MRLGAEADRIHRAGAEVVAIGVDDEDRQAGMFQRWPTPHVQYVADPGGTRFLQPLDLYDPDERGGIGLPGMLVFAPDGRIVYRYVGRDFADRTTDAEVLDAVERLDLPSISAPAGGPDHDVPEELDGYFRTADLGAYFRGNRMAAVAIGGRLDDSEARAVAREHRKMCEATLEAWRSLRS